MAEASPEKKKLHISPVGAFVVGLFLGAGVLFVYHERAIGALRSELEKARQDTVRLEKVQRELRNFLAGIDVRIDKLEGQRPAPK